MLSRSPLAGEVQCPIPLLGFAAYSGTGKTTLLLALLPILKAGGLRVGVVKHAHHNFDVDLPGKDSFRLRTAGADQMLITGGSRIAWIRERRETREQPTLREALAVLDTRRLDLVLVEGFKSGHFPKIELHRQALGLPLLFPEDPDIVAVACEDGPLACDPVALPRLSINDPAGIAAFLLGYIGYAARFNSEMVN